MATVESRTDLKEYCLRRLGYPVIDINLDDSQIEDRIDDALQYYQEFHYDAISKVYLKHVVTQDDIDNRYIPVDNTIVGVIRIFPLNSLMSKDYLFDIRYQLILNNLWDLSSTSMISYTIAMQHIRSLEMMFVGEIPIRFQRHENKIYVDFRWGSSQAVVGDPLIFECYKILDPDVCIDVWNDRWLKRYSTALIKRQWASNLNKFQNITLPGGVTLNGDKLYQDAEQEILKLEDEMQDRFEIPCELLIG